MKKQLGLALAAGLATSAVLVGTGGAANATGPDALSVTFTSSNNSAAATNVTYTWTFAGTGQTAAVDVKTIVVTPPGGTPGSPDLAHALLYGLPSGCTADFSGWPFISLTAASTGACEIGTSDVLALSLGGFTNPSTSGSVSTTIEMDDATSPVATDLARGSDSSSSIAPTSTSVNILVPESLTFTNDTTDIEMTAIPGGAEVDAAPVTMTISTNAEKGYKLDACVTTANALTLQAATTTPAPKIPQAGTTTAAPLSNVASGHNPGFGASATINGTGAALTAPWDGTSSGTNVLGYDSSCTDASGDAQIASNAGPTDGDTLTLTNKVALDGSQAGGTYKGEIDYTVTPTY